MPVGLERLARKLGDGELFKVGSDYGFRLDSWAENPVVSPQDIGLTWLESGQLQVGAVFNGGVELFRDKVVLLPRCHKNYRSGKYFDRKLGVERTCLEDYVSEVWVLESEDGINFRRCDGLSIKADGTSQEDFVHGIEDIRVVRYEERFLLVGCGKTKPPFKGENADRIAVYSTPDFTQIHYHGMVEGFDSRNAVPFPCQLDGKLYTLFRFHPHIHLDYLEAGLEQLLSPSEHGAAWQELYSRRDASILLEAGKYPHEKEKIGPGPQLILTERGWLVIYHAVGEIGAEFCRAYGVSENMPRSYSICAALIDRQDPKRVLCRTKMPLYVPSFPFELYGDERFPVDVPAVVFPVGGIVYEGKLLLYCGAGDKYVIVVGCSLENLLEYLWRYCKTNR